jgi:murein DD-endopeptidase MepM/ murein hydrolase activator NlpD
MKRPSFFTLDWWTQRLSIIIRDEENFAERRKLNYTPAQVGSIVTLSFLAIFALGFWVASMVFSGSTTIGEDATIRRKYIQLANTVDSLAREVQKRDVFAESIKNAVGGKIEKQDVKAPIDTLKKAKKAGNKDSVNIDALSEADVRLREEMETRNNSSPTTFANQKSEQLKDMFFFSPVKGIVSNKYDSKIGHLGVDVVSDKDAPLKAIYEGTVIMASWTDETGYVITVQHQSNLLSIYKHCSVLLKKQGDFVRAGEILAIIGNSGELTTGPHLHFELWYNGNPINPEGMIAF